MTGHLTRLALRATRSATAASGGLRPRTLSLFERQPSATGFPDEYAVRTPPFPRSTRQAAPDASPDPGVPPGAQPVPFAEPGASAVTPVLSPLSIAHALPSADSAGFPVADRAPSPGAAAADSRKAEPAAPASRPEPMGRSERTEPAERATTAPPADPPHAPAGRPHPPPTTPPPSRPEAPRADEPAPAPAVGRVDPARTAVAPASPAPPPQPTPLPRLTPAPREEPAKQGVTVNIGRIEVVQPPKAEPRPAAPRPRAKQGGAPKLADYLRERSRR